MAYYVEEMNKWAIRRIESEAPDDVDLLIGHPQWNVPEDGNEIRFSYFLPNSEKGMSIAKTFVIENIGYDFWGMPWERLEHIASLEESLTAVLLDGTILWSRNKEVCKRFTDLQQLARERLQDRSYSMKTALNRLAEAMDTYKVMAFEDNLSHVRKGLCYIADQLSVALAHINGTYFKKGPEMQDLVPDTLPLVPEGYTDAYRRIIHAMTIEDCCELAHEMIKKVRVFLTGLCSQMEGGCCSQDSTCDYSDMAAWYEEGTYWFRRLYSYTGRGDAARTLQWGYSLQAELDFAQKAYGLDQMDILDAYDPDNLTALNQRGHKIQEYLHNTLLSHNAKIREYASLKEFLSSGE